jgi:hypothetical protein
VCEKIQKDIYSIGTKKARERISILWVLSTFCQQLRRCTDGGKKPLITLLRTKPFCVSTKKMRIRIDRGQDKGHLFFSSAATQVFWLIRPVSYRSSGCNRITLSISFHPRSRLRALTIALDSLAAFGLLIKRICHSDFLLNSHPEYRRRTSPFSVTA